MSSLTTVIIKSHCNSCSQATNHQVLAQRSTDTFDYDDEGHPISKETLLFHFVQCCGCESISMKRTWSASFAEHVEVDYFPPAASRRRPSWMSGVTFLALSGVKVEIRALFDEIYTAMFSGSNRLALMGARAVVEVALTDKLGDIGGFAKKLEEAKSRLWITPAHHKVLEAVVEAGGAAAHRAHSPDTEQLGLVLDMVEHLVQLLYVLEHQADKVVKGTPPRTSIAKKAGDA